MKQSFFKAVFLATAMMLSMQTMANEPQEQESIIGCDFMYVSGNKFCFYKIASRTVVEYKIEKADIFNYHLKKDRHSVFYTVCEGGKLIVAKPDETVPVAKIRNFRGLTKQLTNKNDVPRTSPWHAKKIMYSLAVKSTRGIDLSILDLQMSHTIAYAETEKRCFLVGALHRTVVGVCHEVGRINFQSNLLRNEQLNLAHASRQF